MLIGAVIFLFVGIFSVCYFGAIVQYAGIKAAFLWFWIFLGTGSFVLSGVLGYLHVHKTEVPGYVKAIFLTLLVSGSLIFLTVEGIIISKGKQEPDKKADYVVVLGAQVKGRALSRALKNRLDTALLYLSENDETKVIVSGGQGRGEDISEAEAMSRYLIEKGIAKDRIIAEDKSTSTFENIKFSKAYMTAKNPYLVLVTNEFHVFRSVGIAKKQGFENVQGLGAPNDDIMVLNYYVREFFAVVKDKLIGNI